MLILQKIASLRGTPLLAFPLCGLFFFTFGAFALFISKLEIWQVFSEELIY
jgi:hypothetical protein